MHLHQLETPALILDLDLFEQNIQIMKQYCDTSGIPLRPHYKSHKCPWIARQQLAAGAKGIACATLGEAEDLIQAGIEDVLIANQVPQLSKIARLASLAGCCRLTVCVDDADNIKALSAAAALQNTLIHVLVEYDIGMKRCGVETEDAFIALAKLVDSSPHLEFEGIQAYAGHLSHEEDFEKRKRDSEWVEQRLASLKKAVESIGLTVKEVSGSSTGTVQFRNKDSVYTETQAGSYIFMDKAYRLLNLQFKNSLFLLTQIISIVGKERTITCGGLKSLTIDQTTPMLADYPDAQLALSEEHTTIPFVADTWKRNDYLKIIPGHCCTTVNLHDYLYLIRNDTVIDKLKITSRGKSI